MPLQVTSIKAPIRDLKRKDGGKKVVFCTPTLKKPYPQFLSSLKASIPLIEAAGWEHGATWMIGCAYISAARMIMLRRALDAQADVIVFLDHDLEWSPHDLLTLVETEGDVVAGTYRYKKDHVEYMGSIYVGEQGKPMCRQDGCIHAEMIPAGFLKITREGVNKFMTAYPELLYGEACSPGVDLFNHGVHEGVWFGEDFMFSRRWREKCGDIWLIPDLNLTHYDGNKPFPGNFHRFLLGDSA